MTREEGRSTPRKAGSGSPDDPGDPPKRASDPGLAKTRALLASVEELRALLAPLSEEDRRRVLELARSLRHKRQGAT